MKWDDLTKLWTWREKVRNTDFCGKQVHVTGRLMKTCWILVCPEKGADLPFDNRTPRLARGHLAEFKVRDANELHFSYLGGFLCK